MSRVQEVALCGIIIRQAYCIFHDFADLARLEQIWAVLGLRLLLICNLALQIDELVSSTIYHDLGVLVIHGQNEIQKSIDGVQGCTNWFAAIFPQHTEYECPILKQDSHTLEAH